MALGLTLVWLVVAGLIYTGYMWYESLQRQGLMEFQGQDNELVLRRHDDGHFYVSGQVHQASVLFLIDTGASAVSISLEQAAQARIPSGRKVDIQTANGVIQGELVRGIPVRAGHLVYNDTTVAYGNLGLPAPHALLGQSFLKQFDIEMRENEMILRPRR